MFESALAAWQAKDARLNLMRVREGHRTRFFLLHCAELRQLVDDTATDIGTAAGSLSGYEHAVAEAATLFGVSAATIENRLDVADAVQAHPRLAGAAADGRLCEPHLLAVVGALGSIGALFPGEPELADAVLGGLLPELPEPDPAGPDPHVEWVGTPAQLRDRVTRLGAQIDPDGAERRRAQKLAQFTGVRLRSLGDGLADWRATGSAPQLLAAHHLLDVLSVRRDPDDDRTKGQRQVETLIGALALMAGGQAVPVELQLEIDGLVETERLRQGCDVPEPVVIRAALTPELLHLLTGHDQPSAPAQPVTATAPAQAEDPQARVAPEPVAAPDDRAAEPVHTDSITTEVGAAGPSTAGPSTAGPSTAGPGTAEASPRKWGEPEDWPVWEPGPEPEDTAEPEPPPLAPMPEPPQLPWWARGEDADPLAPFGVQVDGALRPLPPRDGRIRPRGGAAELVGLGALDPALFAALLGAGSGGAMAAGLGPVRLRRLLIDPTGQVVAADPGSRPLIPGQSPGQLLTGLLTDLPQPPPAVDRHDPSAAQQRVVKLRDTRCRFPGCRQPARRCEDDHRNRYPDGPTSTANLHELCKHHHRLKHDGWTVKRHRDGSSTWTSPRGQRVRVPLD